MAARFRPPEHAAMLAGLSLTRLIGWGANYYTPSVLVAFLGRDLGLSQQIVFGGITLLLVIGAFVAPALGRHAERHGTRGLMSVGAVICAAGFVVLAAAQGPFSYLAAWAVIGLGHAMSLSNMGSIAVTQIMGDRARRAIGAMMLVTGLSASVFWPLTTALCESLGWRAACLVFAAMHLAIALPIHLALPRRRIGDAQNAAADAASIALLDGNVPIRQRRATFVLLAVAFSVSGLVSWGLPLHYISLFESSGLSLSVAVAIASLSGPATLAARLIEVMAGDRIKLEHLSLVALLLGGLACLIQMVGGGHVYVTIAFVLCYSASTGVLSIARATLPLTLFGRRSYAVISSRLVLPQNLMFAAAPLLYALMIERAGVGVALAISAALQVVAFGAMMALLGRLSRP